MEKISKKDIRATVKNIIEQAFAKYEISSPSTKTQKLVKNVSKKVSSRIKNEVKKKFKADRKAAKRNEAGKKEKIKKMNTAAA